MTVSDTYTSYFEKFFCTQTLYHFSPFLAQYPQILHYTENWLKRERLSWWSQLLCRFSKWHLERGDEFQSPKLVTLFLPHEDDQDWFAQLLEAGTNDILRTKKKKKKENKIHRTKWWTFCYQCCESLAVKSERRNVDSSANFNNDKFCWHSSHRTQHCFNISIPIVFSPLFSHPQLGVVCVEHQNGRTCKRATKRTARERTWKAHLRERHAFKPRIYCLVKWRNITCRLWNAKHRRLVHTKDIITRCFPKLILEQISTNNN